jgi:uncharacterized protein (TIGR03118 family)
MRSSTWAPRLWMLPLVAFMVAATPSSMFSASSGNSFEQVNLVSDLPGVARFMDPDLVNPWGIAFSPTSPIWVSDNGQGLATIYDGAGVKQGLVVSIPAPGGGSGAPTGQVFNSSPVSTDFGGAHFLFSTEDGTIAAWSGGTTAALPVNNSGAGAVYKGLALASNGGNEYLYATDFHNGKIDVFDNNFTPHSFGAGSFTDPSLPAGYAPFGIQASGGKIYVTFALQDPAKHDDVAGPGHGFLDVFNTDGTFVQRLVTMGALNSPWAMALAPTAGFGKFSGDLLVGNFGDGTINAFDLTTGTQIGTLDGSNGMPLVNQGLWGLAFGNGAQGTSMNTLYFTAGIPGPGNIEDHGLFGSIVSTPEPGTISLLGTGLMSLIGYGWRRGKRSA